MVVDVLELVVNQIAFHYTVSAYRQEYYFDYRPSEFMLIDTFHLSLNFLFYQIIYFNNLYTLVLLLKLMIKLPLFESKICNTKNTIYAYTISKDLEIFNSTRFAKRYFIYVHVDIMYLNRLRK